MTAFPPQEQAQQPGRERDMRPRPETRNPDYRGSGKLTGKVALITGGDSGIGRSVAIHFAREGAALMLAYLNETQDADDTRRAVEAEGAEVELMAGDIAQSSFCAALIRRTIDRFGRLDILVNNAAEQHPRETLDEISDAQLQATFATNIFAQFYLTRAALPHLAAGASVINTTSVTAYRGSPHLLDYSATKGAIVSFTRSLALNLADRGIRVNGVAPGPIWTPLIPSTFDAGKVHSFGEDTPMGRAGQPEEVAPAYVFFASDDAAYVTGQILHVNGGDFITS